jgi:hypothetical protein
MAVRFRKDLNRTSVKKKTSQGKGNVGTSTMNKSKRRSFKKYNGQGK